MKIVINACFGGFSLSPRAIKRFAELKDRQCYFFRTEGVYGEYVPLEGSVEEIHSSLLCFAFDIPNPNEVLQRPDMASWCAMTQEERQANNALFSQHRIDSRSDDRTDPVLIRVVEELGSEAASGECAELKVIEIPDGVGWEISEYDGKETVEEKHRKWS